MSMIRLRFVSKGRRDAKCKGRMCLTAGIRRRGVFHGNKKSDRSVRDNILERKGKDCEKKF